MSDRERFTHHERIRNIPGDKTLGVAESKGGLSWFESSLNKFEGKPASVKVKDGGEITVQSSFTHHHRIRNIPGDKTLGLSESKARLSWFESSLNIFERKPASVKAKDGGEFTVQSSFTHHHRIRNIPVDKTLGDRKSTRLNSCHKPILYAVFCF